jgi:hypothetical protein
MNSLAVNNTWGSDGVVPILIIGAGGEFPSTSFANTFYPLGIEIQYSPHKSAAAKGKIEKLLKSIF